MGVPLTAGQRIRAIVNAVNGSTATGLMVAVAGRAALRRGPRGLILAQGYRLPVPPAPAFTLGNVIVARYDWDLLNEHRPQLLVHEEKHTTQYAVCGGLLYLPLYVAASGWSWLRTGDVASRNVFERGAGLVDGGYREQAVRPLFRRDRLA
ncbi:hypothetical protein ATK17_1638 [Branchiibius hedensis]|uniref:DUF4157 domain-containing protein n=1 Tax=Branchiibius hedensis TaxID=672460 RepID=A0A2Y8ZPN6_9MICO|nr:hypothetical protein [Branchiibius hedensis]PWJ25508.1 hypothetical protein ATK17_1638 [Branchiibius hedensis]SSA34321.1 hypothetical protein SAMN04489750_1638 [Branchiibius hedensis]